MQQLVTADNASCGQDNVDLPSYCYTEFAHLSVVLRGLDNGVFAAENDQVKSRTYLIEGRRALLHLPSWNLLDL